MQSAAGLRSVQRYFEFVQKAVDVNRELSTNWADAVNSFTGAVREQTEKTRDLTIEQADKVESATCEQTDKVSDREDPGPPDHAGHQRQNDEQNERLIDAE